MANLSLTVDAVTLSETLSARTGLSLASMAPPLTSLALFRVSDLPERKGLTVLLGTTWRSVEAIVRPENFAAALVRQMGAAPVENREKFVRFWKLLASAGMRLSMRVNDSVVAGPESLPLGPWSSMELTASRLADPLSSQALLDQLAKEVCGAGLSAVLCLLEIEEVPEPTGGEQEGKVWRVESNRYERSPANRAACIVLQGARCAVCGFDFERVYGSLGAGFIEVHHLVPVSAIGPGYIVDPSVDLVPLCSNCHSMVHRRDPPIRIEELRALYELGTSSAKP